MAATRAAALAADQAERADDERQAGGEGRVPGGVAEGERPEGRVDAT